MVESTAYSGRTVSVAAALVGLWAGAAAVAMLAVVMAPQPLLPGMGSLARLAGLLAGYAVTVSVLLMSRTSALERGIGADRISRWHGFIGRITIMLILTHGVFATVSWSMVHAISLPAAVIGVLGMPGLAAAVVGTAMLVCVGVASARAARRKLRYETWHSIHLLTYVAIALSFSHDLAGPDLAAFPVIQVLWSCLYTVGFALLVRYRVLSPLLRALRHRLRVERVVSEGDGVISVVVAGRHREELEAESGQLFRWRFLAPSTCRSAHPFPSRPHRDVPGCDSR